MIVFKHIPKQVLFASIFLTLFFINGQAQKLHSQSKEMNERYFAFISDTHMGMGEKNGKWSRTEDFRWPIALKKLLDKLHQLGKGNVDLILVGDILELWQAPSDIDCNRNGDADFGCTIEEAKELTRRVLKAHKESFEALKQFSQKGNNHIYFIPGNHDAALTHKAVWHEVSDVLDAKSGRITWVKNGIWQSPDKLIIAEHGQQIGSDVNRFDDWPITYDKTIKRFIRPFGEQGVQKLFNEQEAQFPIIDNLSPEIQGAWLRAKDRGVWGSAKDLARLSWFLIIQTSIDQKVDLTGKNDKEQGLTKKLTSFEINEARDLGFTLIANALPLDDPLRHDLLSEEVDEKIKKLQSELTKQVKELPDEAIQTLCAYLVLRASKKLCGSGSLGKAGAKSILEIFMAENAIMSDHLSKRKKRYPDFVAFIYGHTHKFEIGHSVKLKDDVSETITVFNSGAFQRVIDFKNYKNRMRSEYPGKELQEGLSLLKHNKDLLPCYTVIHGPHKFGDKNIRFETKFWIMPEDEKAEGIFRSVGTHRCEW